MMGRPSVAPHPAQYKAATQESLIDMNSPSPCKKGEGRLKEELPEEREEEVDEEEERIREQEFQAGLLQREEKLVQLQRELEEKTAEMEQLRLQLDTKLDSENQMKDVVAEYEKTISELIADKEKEKKQLEVE